MITLANTIFTLNTRIIVNESNIYDEVSDRDFEYLRNEYTIDKFGRLRFSSYDQEDSYNN